MVMTNKGNGHQATPAEEMRPQVMWAQRQSSNAMRPLVEPGKEVRDILMRTVLEDANQARDAWAYIDWCDEFELEEEKDGFLNFLALLPSIKGRSRMELTMALTGIFDSRVYGVKGDTTKLQKQVRREQESNA